MTWRLLIAPKVQESLRFFPPKTKRYIRQALGEIVSDPTTGKVLKDELDGFRSYRTGRFRIVYKVQSSHKRIQVLGVGRRETIYAEVVRRGL